MIVDHQRQQNYLNQRMRDLRRYLGESCVVPSISMQVTRQCKQRLLVLLSSNLRREGRNAIGVLTLRSTRCFDFRQVRIQPCHQTRVHKRSIYVSYLSERIFSIRARLEKS
jgi:hypothetical protein